MAHLDMNNRMVMNQAERNTREQKYRFRWIEKNKKLLEKAATLQRPPTNYHDTDILEYGMKAGMPVLTRDNIARGRNNIKIVKIPMPTLKDVRKHNTIAKLGIADPNDDLWHPDSDSGSDPIMRPVDPQTTAILYGNYPHMAAETYLKERALLIPEDRYYFPECTSMDYGWRLKDAALPKGPTFPLVMKIQREIERNVGPQPDPPHYKYPDEKVKCT